MSNGPDAHLGTWLTVGVLIGLALALLLGVVVFGVRRVRRARHRSAAPAPATPDRGRAEQPFPDDDLPGFAAQPPGWTPPASSAPPSPVEGGPATGSGTTPGPTDLGRGTTTAVAVAVALLVAAVAVAYVGGGRTASAQSTTATTATRQPDPAPTAPAAQPAPASATAAEAAALALESVPLGADGVAASVTFQGVVLEQRAVGLTVTYPSVSVSTDGVHALAHVRLPTYNCLAGEPPVDPVAAGCLRSLTEYADLADPQLQVSRDGDRLTLAGLFATYTRANGSAPAYTGRAYQLSAQLVPDGPAEDGAAPAAGVVRLGLDSAPSTTDPEVNRLQYPG